jgi:hypothetical protein
MRSRFLAIFDRTPRKSTFRQKNHLSLNWIEQLERREVPALITWTGAGGTNLWSDAKNWSSGVVPTQSDEVVVEVPSEAAGTVRSILIESSVEIDSIRTSLLVSMIGPDASLKLTSGQSTFQAGLDLQYAGLTVQGTETVVTLNNDGLDPLHGQVMALGGGKIQWNGVQSLNNMVLFVGQNSSVEMPDLETIANISEITNMSGSFTAKNLRSITYSRLSLFQSGLYDVPALADASMSLIEVHGSEAVVNLPGLTQFDGGRFKLDQGATVTADQLQVVNVGPATAWSFSWFVGQESHLNLPQLIYINALPQPSPNEAPDARILLRGNGHISFDTSRSTATNGLVSFSFSGDSKLDASLILGKESVVTGSGTIHGSVDNFGLFSPSGDYSPYGTFTVTGDWTNRPSSVIDLKLGGPAKLDRLMIGGQATILGGELKIDFSDEFSHDPLLVPEGNFQLMSWGSWAGQFTTAPSLVPRSDGIQITALSRYQPNGLVESLSRFRTDPDIISVSDMSFVEGPTGVSFGIFRIHRSGPMTVPLTIDYQVIPGTARPGVDYQFPNGPITLAPGETERQIRFIIRGNSVYSGDKTFHVKLTGVSDRGVLGQSVASITLVEDDPKPVVIKTAPFVSKPVLNSAVRKPMPVTKAKPVVVKRPLPKRMPVVQAKVTPKARRVLALRLAAARKRS